MTALTLEDAREYARLEVERMGSDFRYTQPGSGAACFYVSTLDPRVAYKFGENGPSFVAMNADKSGCIVGGIINRAELMTDQIVHASMNVKSLVSVGYLAVDGYATEMYLFKLQKAQDEGFTWGEAYRLAEEWAEER